MIFEPMANLKEIRLRISSVENTQKVTGAMKMVAAAKLRRAQEAIFSARPYAFKIHEFIAQLQGTIDPATHPLLKKQEVVKKVLVVLITGDKGLAGPFNTNAIKTAEALLKNEYASYATEGSLKMLCIGRKGHDYFTRRGFDLIGDYRGAFNHLNAGFANGVVEVITEGFLKGEWDEVKVVYNEFRNTISQNLIAEPFLPIPEEEFLTPVMEKDHTAEVATNSGKGKIDYIFEPSADVLMKEIVPRYLNLQLYRMLLESNAAEQGARMMAMDNATTNAGELLRQLKLTYNRVRQAAITTEIIEVSSGAEALNKG